MMNVALICAKGHSSRIPNKNIRLFHGKPIIAYSIDAAKAAGIDKVFVSTDDYDIAEIAKGYGAISIMRGHELTLDNYGPVDVARAHFINGDLGNPEMVCILYATAPMVRTEDIINAEKVLAESQGIGFVVSVGLEPLHDAAQFIWCEPWALKAKIPEFGGKTVMFPVSPETDCDINTWEDWKRAEGMYLKSKHKHRYVLVPNEIPEMVHFRCKCGESLPT